MTNPESDPAAAGCLRCGARFECGASAGKCWCQGAGVLQSIDASQPNCYCPECLAFLLAQEQATPKAGTKP